MAGSHTVCLLKGLNSEALEAALFEEYSIANQATKSFVYLRFIELQDGRSCELARASSTQAAVERDIYLLQS